MPLPVMMLLMMSAFIIAYQKKNKLVCGLMLCAVIVLLLTSTAPLTREMSRHLETQYPVLEQPGRSVSTIVVLSGGYNGMHLKSANNNVNTITLCRTIEGVRLAKAIEQQNRSVRLILSGAKNTGVYMRDTAVMLGVPKAQTRVAPRARDTYHQALSLQQTLAGHPFILVTSAVHMARAMALFQKVNLQPVAAPTCFSHRMSRLPWGLNYVPWGNTLFYFNLAWHEYVGWVWGRIRGLL